MAKLTKSIRKLIVVLLGFPLIILGVILIPLPGPGLLISFLGFFILSLEFAWAERYVQKAKNEIKRIIKNKPTS